MNVLLTGATGFLGSHLARALLDRGDAVFAYRRRSSSLARLAGAAERIKWFDLDAGEISYPFDEREIDAVIHAATCYGRGGESTPEIVETNVLLPVRILDLVKAHGRPPFANIDSFFTKAGPAYQNAPRYTVSKRQLREWLESDAAASLAILSFRLEHVYGPHDAPSKFIPATLSALAANQPRLALTPGEQRRDFIYVADVVSAILCVLDRTQRRPGFVEFDVGRGESLSLRDLVETAKSVLGSTTVLGFGDLPYVQGELMHSKADIRPLCALGWLPTVALKEGLRHTAAAIC